MKPPPRSAGRTQSTASRTHARPGLLLLRLFSAASVVTFGCAGPPATPAPDRDPLITRVETGLLPEDAADDAEGRSLRERMEYWKVPGVSVAVIRNHEIAWARVYGWADVESRRPLGLDTLFQAGSISKPVAAAGALRLVAEGRLDLDRPINDFLTSWQLPANALTEQSPVTLRLLLSHTAGTTVHGFPGYPQPGELPALTQVLDGEPPANTAPVRVDQRPGSQFRYSGGGTTVVQQAVVDVTGTEFATYMRDAVLEPAGMHESTFEQPLPPARAKFAAAGYDRNGRPIAGGRHVYPEMAAAGLWTTASDLARFLIAVQRSWRGEPEALLPHELVTEMLTPVRDGAGLGVFVRTTEGAVYFEHGGVNAGFQAMFVAERDRGLGAVVLTNSGNGVRLADEIIRAVARVYEWPGYPPRR